MSANIAKHELYISDSISNNFPTSSKFLGFPRSDGRVGTANFWLVVPTVFCENRNLDVIKEALLYQLGYQNCNPYASYVNQLVQIYKSNSNPIIDEQIIETNLDATPIFNNVTGIKFLNHNGGCGGTRQDADSLARLLAAYINHPNVGGVSIISLGCQNLQTQQLLQYVKTANPSFNKPLHILEQQQSQSEPQFIASAIHQIIQGLGQINQCKSIPTPFSQLSIGIQVTTPLVTKTEVNNVNKVISHLVASDCKVLMAQNDNTIIRGLVKSQLNDPKLIRRFEQLFQLYQPIFTNLEEKLQSNPHFLPWVTAADVLDYAETAIHSGLNWMFTPPNQAVTQTALVAGGATVLIKIGAPIKQDSYNPICPLIYFSNQPFKGKRFEKQLITYLSNYSLSINSEPNSELFLPWKRGVSL